MTHLQILDLTYCQECGEPSDAHSDACPLFLTPDVVLTGEGW